MVLQVDRIIDNLLQLIYSYDLVSLRELWVHFDQRMFSKLDQEFAPGKLSFRLDILSCYLLLIILISCVAIKKLESSVLKYYVINALTNNKIDKVTEFLSKMVTEIQGQNEWKDWYGKFLHLPFPGYRWCWSSFFVLFHLLCVIKALTHSLCLFFSLAIFKKSRRQPTICSIFHEAVARHLISNFT